MCSTSSFIQSTCLIWRLPVMLCEERWGEVAWRDCRCCQGRLHRSGLRRCRGGEDHHCNSPWDRALMHRRKLTTSNYRPGMRKCWIATDVLCGGELRRLSAMRTPSPSVLIHFIWWSHLRSWSIQQMDGNGRACLYSARIIAATPGQHSLESSCSSVMQ